MIATLITRDAPAQSGTRYVPDWSTATMDGWKKILPRTVSTGSSQVRGIRVRWKVTNGALEPYDMSSSGPTADRSDQPLLYAAKAASSLPRLSYYVIILRGFSRGYRRMGKGGRRGEVVGANHAPSSSLSSDPCLPQGRSRRIYDLTVLWRVGETVLRNVDKKISPAWYLCMRNISRTHVHTVKQQQLRDTLHLSFQRQCFAY